MAAEGITTHREWFLIPLPHLVKCLGVFLISRTFASIVVQGFKRLWPWQRFHSTDFRACSERTRLLIPGDKQVNFVHQHNGDPCPAPCPLLPAEQLLQVAQGHPRAQMHPCQGL